VALILSASSGKVGANSGIYTAALLYLQKKNKDKVKVNEVAK
jgi:hypothetical protein